MQADATARPSACRVNEDCRLYVLIGVTVVQLRRLPPWPARMGTRKLLRRRGENHDRVIDCGETQGANCVRLVTCNRAGRLGMKTACRRFPRTTRFAFKRVTS